MNKLRQEYCEENGLNYIKPENAEMKEYVIWLEKRIEALSIANVVGRSEQLKAFQKMVNETEGYVAISDELIDKHLKSL